MKRRLITASVLAASMLAVAGCSQVEALAPVGGNHMTEGSIQIGLDDFVYHAQLIAHLAVGAGLIWASQFFDDPLSF